MSKDNNKFLCIQYKYTCLYLEIKSGDLLQSTFLVIDLHNNCVEVLEKILFRLLFYRATLMYRYAYFRYMYMNTLTGSWNNLALFGSNPFLKPINPSIYPFINNHLFLWKIFIILQKITISLYLKNPLSLASRNIQSKKYVYLCVFVSK